MYYGRLLKLFHYFIPYTHIKITQCSIIRLFYMYNKKNELKCAKLREQCTVTIICIRSYTYSSPIWEMIVRSNNKKIV